MEKKLTTMNDKERKNRAYYAIRKRNLRSMTNATFITTKQFYEAPADSTKVRLELGCSGVKNPSSHRCPRCHVDLRTLPRNNFGEDPRLSHIRSCVYRAATTKGGADVEVASGSGCELDDAAKFDKRNDKGNDVIRDVDVDEAPSTSTSKQQDMAAKISKEKTKNYYEGMATCITFSQNNKESDLSAAFEALRGQLRDHIVQK